MDKFLQTAVKAARMAGDVHRKYTTGPLAIRVKNHSFDRVTAADLEAERVITECIRQVFPDHNFLAEENRYEQTSSEYTWVIDPLDGTNNFTFGLPIYCVSIALARKDEVILGVVYDASRDELFHAEKGKGAFLNGERIHVSAVDEMKASLLVTGFYYDRGKDMIENLEIIKRFFLQHIIGIRRLGAAALDLCYVACGRFTGYWEFLLSPWDFAAGKLIIEEAGGKVTGRTGGPVPLAKNFVVASNGKIHPTMLQTINVS